MRFIQFLPALIFIFVALSCQKVIQIDLNSASPQTIIEANITNTPGPYFVRISKTVNFNDSNKFPPVTGATVVIRDSFNNVTFQEVSPGVYSTSAFTGNPGKSYFLKVSTGSIEFDASSSMPEPVNIDTILIVNEIRFSGRTRKQAEVHFRDPEGIANYYRFKLIVNGKGNNDYSLSNDMNRDGKEIIRDLDLGDSASLKQGDIVTVILESIDKATYNYFRTLRQASGAGGLGFLSASPSNPITNWNKGALGYFSAYSITSKTILVSK